MCGRDRGRHRSPVTQGPALTSSRPWSRSGRCGKPRCAETVLAQPQGAPSGPVRAMAPYQTPGREHGIGAGPAAVQQGPGPVPHRCVFLVGRQRFVRALEVRVLEEKTPGSWISSTCSTHKVLALWPGLWPLPDKLRDCTKKSKRFSIDHRGSGPGWQSHLSALALFAEMVGGKQWTARHITGHPADGGDRRHLPRRRSPRRPPRRRHRLHRKAVQAVLAILLPNRSRHQGQVRSRDELLELSGCSQAEETFAR